VAANPDRLKREILGHIEAQGVGPTHWHSSRTGAIASRPTAEPGSIVPTV